MRDYNHACIMSVRSVFAVYGHSVTTLTKWCRCRWRHH